MGKSPRNNGHRITRLTLSGGNRAEPRLMTTRSTRWPSRWNVITGVALTLTFVILVWLAGRS